MPFGSNRFSNSQSNFGKDFNQSFNPPGADPGQDFAIDNPFNFTPKDSSYRSRIRFYDHDSVWTRWRRGYELYVLTQSTLGSYGDQRSNYGDYRFYCAYQLYPGIFIPARIFTFPTNNQEILTQLVGIRDANGFNFYNYGMPILAVRYLGAALTGAYTQSGNAITVTSSNHGFRIGDNIYLVFNSGTAVSATLPVTAATKNTFTCLASGSLTTSGNVSAQISTTFDDIRWTETRVKIRSIFQPIPQLIGERITDRVFERDPGVQSTYSRSGTTVTVNCSTPHGLATGNTVFVSVQSGTVISKQYTVKVTSSTQLTFVTSDSTTTSGSLIVNRLIPGYDYNNYVGYTLTGVDNTNNELIFQRADSYGAKLVNNKATTTVPAERGFLVGRFLTTEIRYQCSCQDYSRREGYNMYETGTDKRFPVTPITSVKPGERLNKNNTLTNERDNDGVFSDLGFVTPVSNFYGLPDYGDTTANSYTNLNYYQLRWCKHIYAALFSLNHDEGNTPVLGSGAYVQSGPNITITINNHGLVANERIQVDFTSGNALSGEYVITQILNVNTFNIVYPYSGSTRGYCNISNVKRHQFIDAWLLEPSDKPVGDGLDVFYENFTKENARLGKAIERLSMMKQGLKWVGTVTGTGAGNLPQQTANYSPELASMLLTDDIRRVEEGLDRQGTLQNSTQRMISIMSKLLNVEPSVIIGEKFGLLDQPLSNYLTSYPYGLINAGDYLNGKPYSVQGASTTTSGTVTEDPNVVTQLDCGTYNPYINQDFTVDAGIYA
jgi:hypothetical protein